MIDRELFETWAKAEKEYDDEYRVLARAREAVSASEQRMKLLGNALREAKSAFMKSQDYVPNEPQPAVKVSAGDRKAG